jgi:hypothetical protein
VLAAFRCQLSEVYRVVPFVKGDGRGIKADFS